MTTHFPPIFDLHCDLLYYLTTVPGADSSNTEEIGCAWPHMLAGNVRWQTMAIYTPIGEESVKQAFDQARAFEQLTNQDPWMKLDEKSPKGQEVKVAMIAAIENASGICIEDEPLDNCWSNLEELQKHTGSLFYISLTHHYENRFGGGNYADAGLKEDGKVLLDFLDQKRIAIDLAHSSDALAYGIIDHIDKLSLDIPIIASHSNFRSVCDHARNLPDELAKEIINRQGLIGMNFLRAYVHDQKPEMLLDHINYGWELGALDQLGFGADFFCVKNFPDVSRFPLFFPELDNATHYHSILEGLVKSGAENQQVAKLCSQNVLNFLERMWR
ncbi:MAG: dipeptidase [Cyclobacteriaceae bacterium]